MKVNFKKLHPNAEIPTYATKGAAGMDIKAVSREIDKYGNVSYNTGLAIQLPEGFVGLLFARSSISKHPLDLRNSVGVLDSDYTGEIKFKFNLLNAEGKEPIYNPGDRIGQIIILPYPKIELIEVEELVQTERGEGGFGHTGQ
jgi:dUTP pyrophosphatase